MKQIDLRFHKNHLKELIGKEFYKFKFDGFINSNSVYLNVGLFIGKYAYRLSNTINSIDYYGEKEDIGVFEIQKCDPKEIKSGFLNEKLKNFPVGQVIKKIIVVNENRVIYINNKKEYDNWITRGIIFDFGDNQLMFEKDIWDYSEDITILKGYDLLHKMSDEHEFLEEWPDNYKAYCHREIEEIV